MPQRKMHAKWHACLAGMPHLQLGHRLLLHAQHNGVRAPHTHRQRALAHRL